jgi:hypothetical protein
MEFSCNLAGSVLVRNPRGLKMLVYTDCSLYNMDTTQMPIKQEKDKLWHIHVMKYYSAIKRDVVASYAVT